MQPPPTRRQSGSRLSTNVGIACGEATLFAPRKCLNTVPATGGWCAGRSLLRTDYGSLCRGKILAHLSAFVLESAFQPSDWAGAYEMTRGWRKIIIFMAHRPAGLDRCNTIEKHRVPRPGSSSPDLFSGSALEVHRSCLQEVTRELFEQTVAGIRVAVDMHRNRIRDKTCLSGVWPLLQ